MTTDVINRIVGFVVLCLVQALVLNHIHIFGFATPLLYVYMVLQFRRNYPKWGILLWSFLLGMVIDTFSNTPGVSWHRCLLWQPFNHTSWNFSFNVTLRKILDLRQKVLV